MSEAAFATAVADVVDRAVILPWADAAGHLIETQQLADPPSDVVVGAGGVAGDADSADMSLLVIKGKTAPEGLCKFFSVNSERAIVRSL